MLKWLNLLCILSIAPLSKAQDSLKIIPWELAVDASPDTVFAIDASHLKWETIPTELYAFKNLTYLDISRNKLKELPDELGKLNKLTKLNATKNQMTGGLPVICQLTQLKHLAIARNQFTMMPECVGFLADLQVLDIWDNPITSLPDELMKCKKLKAVDMRGILLTPSFQEKWQKQMPDVTWFFDAPCHCVE